MPLHSGTQVYTGLLYTTSARKSTLTRAPQQQYPEPSRLHARAGSGLHAGRTVDANLVAAVFSCLPGLRLLLHGRASSEHMGMPCCSTVHISRSHALSIGKRRYPAVNTASLMHQQGMASTPANACQVRGE